MYKKHFADQNMNILDNAVGKKTDCFMTAEGCHGKKKSKPSVLSIIK